MPDKTGRKPQTNIVLGPQALDVLDALVYLEERSGPDILRPVLHAYLEERAQEPKVKALLAMREETRNETAKTVRPIRGNGEAET